MSIEMKIYIILQIILMSAVFYLFIEYYVQHLKRIERGRRKYYKLFTYALKPDLNSHYLLALEPSQEGKHYTLYVLDRHHHKTIPIIKATKEEIINWLNRF